MGMPVENVVVDGVRFQITLLDAVTARRLYLRLVKSIAPGLASLAKAFSANKSDGAEMAPEEEAELMTALADIVAGLDVQLFDDLCDAFAAATIIPRDDGSTLRLQPAFGAYFAGKYTFMIKWLLAALSANKFLDFLPGNFDRASEG